MRIEFSDWPPFLPLSIYITGFFTISRIQTNNREYLSDNKLKLKFWGGYDVSK